MVSVKELAKHAGVSTATVSRVLNNCDSVKESNRARVLQSIDELGYQMNVNARNLRIQKSKNLIALIPSIRNPLFAEIITGLSDKVKEHGYHMFLGTIEHNMQNVEPYINMLLAKQADGIIFISKTFDEELLRKLQGKFPIVLCNETQPGLDFPLVSIDNYQAGYDAVQYLYQQGCRSIAFVAGRTTSASTANRIRGYQQAMDENSLPYGEDDVIFGANSDIQETNLIKKFVEKKRYDGFVVNSDLKAALVMKSLLALHERSYKMVSLDGTYICDIYEPAFTSITQPMYQIGTAAAGLMIDILSNKPHTSKIILPHSLTKRDT